MTALEECHDRGFIWKSMGMCSDAKHSLNMCLRAERLKRQGVNRSKTAEKKAKVREAWKEIDENS